MMSIRLLVADDHEVVRTGLKSLFVDSGIEIVAEAEDGIQAVKRAKKFKPDVVLMDIRMGDNDGLMALDRLHRELPETRVVMLSTYDNPTYIARSVALGASDYVLKGTGRAELIAAIEAAAEGRQPPEGSELHRIAGTMARRKKGDHEDPQLTNRESQVLRHIALGLSNKEIGQSLGISVETVKEHVQNILRKISSTDRTQAAVWAVKNGFVE